MIGIFPLGTYKAFKKQMSWENTWSTFIPCSGLKYLPTLMCNHGKNKECILGAIVNVSMLCRRNRHGWRRMAGADFINIL
jgi:hypothetical protein